MATSSPTPDISPPPPAAPDAPPLPRRGVPVFTTVVFALVGIAICWGNAQLLMIPFFGSPPAPEDVYHGTLWQWGIFIVLGFAFLAIGERTGSIIWVLGPICLAVGISLMAVTAIQHQHVQQENAEARDWLDRLPIPNGFERRPLTEEPRELYYFDNGSEWLGEVTLRLDNERSLQERFAVIDPILQAAGAEPMPGGCDSRVAYYRLEDGNRVLLLGAETIQVIYETKPPPPDAGGNHAISEPDRICSGP